MKFNLVALLLISSLSNAVEERKLSRQKRLLFPQFTTLQISMCLIAQISQLPDHRVALNIGFQMNYNLPFNLSSWYSPMFWARKLSGESNPLVALFERLSESDDDDESSESAERKYGRRKRDLSAGEFYLGLMDSFNIGGYHDDCLLKSICELARHPIAVNETEENLMHELVHYILTPSAHKAFDSQYENEEQKLYEEAEAFGKNGENCELIYNECEKSPLDDVSNFIN